MPRVKIDYIVSFSSEDPEHPASNLLSLEINKKKWLCKSGETSCSVVFQLTKAVEISSVQIGGSQVALVEVLVGRSESPADPFQVLVPSSVFLSPTESRRDLGAASERVRTFANEQLAVSGKFDRVRVVCSQPYNKHCKFGLSFIHIYEPESLDKAPRNPEVPASDSIPLTISKPALNSSFVFESEGEEDFRPGELFAKHLQNTSNTDAQIRRASSHALKNISDSSTKLTKTPINKHNNNSGISNNDVASTSRQRDDLMYTRDDEQPHAKIDRIVNRHKDEKIKESDSKTDEKRDKKHKENHKKEPSSDSKKEAHRSEDKRYSEDINGDATRTKKRDEASTSHRSERDSKKRRHSGEKRHSGLVPGPVTSTPERLLSHVTFALSGYENPRRAALRSAACALGARYLRDWNPQCTHLICAFPNTPKLRTVRTSGADCIAVTGEWVEQCFSSRRLLPEPWFATETQYRVKRPDDLQLDDDEEGDTDEEIEKLLQKNKKQKTDKSPTTRDNSSTRREKSPSRSDRSISSRDRSPKQSNKSPATCDNTSTRRDRSPTQRDTSPSQRDRSPKHIDKSPTSRDRSPKRKKKSASRRDKSSEQRDRSPLRSDSSSSHTTKSPSRSSHKTTSIKDNKPSTIVKSNDSDRTISPVHDTSADSDVAFVKDERIQGNVTVPSDSDTEPDSPASVTRDVTDVTLPELFRDVTFCVHVTPPHDVTLIERYIKAYGGFVLHESQLDDDSEVDYIICTEVPSPARRCVAALPPAWLWRCHKEKVLVDVADYKLN